MTFAIFIPSTPATLTKYIPAAWLLRSKSILSELAASVPADFLVISIPFSDRISMVICETLRFDNCTVNRPVVGFGYTFNTLALIVVSVSLVNCTGFVDALASDTRATLCVCVGQITVTVAVAWATFP